MRFWTRGRRTRRNPQSQSLLFNLPAELRLQIFELALNCPSIWLIAYEKMDGPHIELVGGRGIIPPTAPIIASRLLSLLLSCARGYDEGLPVLYGSNSFCVCSLRTLRLLGYGVGAPYITRLEVMVGTVSHKLRGLLGKIVSQWDPWQVKEYIRERKWARQWDLLRKFKFVRYLLVELETPDVIWQETLRPHELMFIKPLEGLLREGTVGKLRLFWDRPIGHQIAAEEVLSNWEVERVVEDHELRRWLAERSRSSKFNKPRLPV